MIFKKISLEFAQFNLDNLDEMKKLLMDSYQIDSATSSSGPYGDLNGSTIEVS